VGVYFVLLIINWFVFGSGMSRVPYKSLGPFVLVRHKC
jgi:hypothetical protein